MSGQEYGQAPRDWHEQPLPSAGRQSVTRAVRDLLDQRERKGVETYGTTLQTFNGRDAGRDLVEELIDGVQYAMQLRLERGALEVRCTEAETRLTAALRTLAAYERACAEARALCLGFPELQSLASLRAALAEVP